MSNLKGGVVVKIRVNPEDVMSCIDIVKQAKISTYGLSLPIVVRIALSGLLHAARTNGALPIREGFEFSNMLAEFGGVQQGRKLASAAVVEQADVHKRMDMDRQAPREMPDTVVAQRARWMVRLNELEFKQKNDPLNFDSAEHAELINLKELWAASEQEWQV